MANVKQYSHSYFNHPGDEGDAQGRVEAQAEERNNDVPSPSHDVVQKPGDEGSSGMSGNDDAYMQGYLCDAVDQKAPGYVGPGGPEVRRTFVPPTEGADPTPEMPGAK